MTFTSFSDLLPDPNNPINTAGVSDSSGNYGPGFAKIRFSSNNQVQVSRTISGRGVTASPGYHTWSFDITYNPMIRSDFDPVSSFLEGRRGRLNPFYIILPQHRIPKDPTFYSFIDQGYKINPVSTVLAGTTKINIKSTVNISGTPSPGDFFNIVDPSDINHTKTYKVIRVETPTNYQTGLPVSTGNLRIHIQPPVTRTASASSEIVFINPKFRVIQRGDTLEYELDTDNLYQFSLSAEEILP